MIDISQSSIELMQHALGIDERNREPYRNYFLSSHGDNEWEELVNKGLATSYPAPKGFCGDVYYQVTDEGKNVAIAKLPEPKKPTKYDEYLSSEVVESFSEWLGIVLPEYDYRRGDNGNREYQMSRTKFNCGYEIECIRGEWMPTMKAAKASYKEALKLFRSTHG